MTTAAVLAALTTVAYADKFLSVLIGSWCNANPASLEGSIEVTETTVRTPFFGDTASCDLVSYDAKSTMVRITCNIPKWQITYYVSSRQSSNSSQSLALSRFRREPSVRASDGSLGKNSFSSGDLVRDNKRRTSRKAQCSVLRVRPKTSSWITKLSHHEADGREFQECEGIAVEIFPVLGEAATTVEPRNRAFYDPALG